MASELLPPKREQQTSTSVTPEEEKGDLNHSKGYGLPNVGHPPRNLADCQADSDSKIDAIDTETDHFYMYIYKVAPCLKNYTHDWSSCPFAHKGEKAARRDPLKFSYMASNCPHFKDGSCPYGDACLYSHGVFESCLHPERYKTQMCNMGAKCNRSVCFFAHSAKELRTPTCQPCEPQSKMNSSNASTISAILGHSAGSSPVKQTGMQHSDATSYQHPTAGMRDSRHQSFTTALKRSEISGDILNQAASLLCALQLIGGQGQAASAETGETDVVADSANMGMTAQNSLRLQNGSTSLPASFGNINIFGALHSQSPWQHNFGAINGLARPVDWAQATMDPNTAPCQYAPLSKSKSAPVHQLPIDNGCNLDFLDNIPDMAIPQTDNSSSAFRNLQPFSYLAS